jgi:hypothetical protein
MRTGAGLWSIEAVQVARLELDFGSSSGGKHEVSAVEADGTPLCNALEFVAVEEDGLAQIRVCECCGHPRCESGGWVKLRRLGESVLWLPAWSEMEAGGWEQGEYCSPSFLDFRGVPCFRQSVWGLLRELHPSLPRAEDLESVNSREAVRWVQLSAPGELLGVFPDPPRLQRELLLAVSMGELAPEVAFTESILERGMRERLRLEPVRPEEPLERIEFALDLPKVPLWAGVARSRQGPCLLPAVGLAFLCA